MSKFKNSILTELGIKESSLPQSAVREDAFPGIDPENQDDSMEQEPSARDRMMSPTAKSHQVLAVAVRGSNTGGLPSGNNMSRGKLGGYEPISNAKENSLVVNKTPDSKVIASPAPIANDGGAESTPAEEHPHQTQTATDEPPQAVTGASQEDNTSLKLTANLPKGIDVDVSEENHENGEESKEEMQESKGLPIEKLIAARQSLQEKAQKGTMSKKESEVFACITEVLKKRGFGLEEKLFSKKSMLETAGVESKSKESLEDKLSNLKKRKDDEKAGQDHKKVQKKLDAAQRRDDLA
jgi:hypothetical protein